MKFTISSILSGYRVCCKVNFSQKKPTQIRGSFTSKANKHIIASNVTQVAESEIRDHLKETAALFSEGYTCFHIIDHRNCTLCRTQKQKIGSIFVNKKTGFFLCDHCKITGEWNVFKALQNVHDNVRYESIIKECEKYNNDAVAWAKIVTNTTLLTSFNDEEYRKVFKDFHLTYCPKGTLNDLQVRINCNRNILYLPLFSSNSDVVGYQVFDKKGLTKTSPKVNCAGYLFSGVKKKSAVIVAQVQDFFALLSQNIPHQIVCLPYGVRILPQAALPFLEKYDEIILWLGEGALNATGNLAKKLNDKRCQVVRPTGNRLTVLTALLKKENIKNILKEAKPTWHQFVTTFHSLRDEVLAELQNTAITTGVQWKRFPDLNQILKGHRRGELTVLTGPTGAGKTTFLSEYSLDLAMQGVNTLWGSFEVKNPRLARMMLTQYAEGPLPEDRRSFDAVADKFEQLPIFFLTFHGQQSIETVMEAVEHCSYTFDIAHVIIDNVQFMIEVMTSASQLDRFWKQDFLVQSFRSFASKNNCHVTLVMHPRKEMEGADLSINSIFGGAKASQEADNILIIQTKQLTPLGGKKFLQVCKNRYSGDLGFTPLRFDKSSLSFSKKKKLEEEVEKAERPLKKVSHKTSTRAVEEEEEEEEENFQEVKSGFFGSRKMKLNDVGAGSRFGGESCDEMDDGFEDQEKAEDVAKPNSGSLL